MRPLDMVPVYWGPVQLGIYESAFQCFVPQVNVFDKK
jgi:hypothetical protein